MCYIYSAQYDLTQTDDTENFALSAGLFYKPSAEANVIMLTLAFPPFGGFLMLVKPELKSYKNKYCCA